MVKKSFLSRLKRFWFSSRDRRTTGFTLLELLIVTIIASIIVSGLLYIVVELLGVDQRESAQTETQREMQLALDYMSSELREAVYVYTGECLAGQTGCSGLANYLPASLSTGGSTPILAFWKPQPLPPNIRTLCSGNTPAPNIPECIAGGSYALVVYSLNTEESDIWKGRARITRYALTQYTSGSSTSNQAYVDPVANKNFSIWPFAVQGGALVNLQRRRPSDSPAALVDFVDDGQGATESRIPGLPGAGYCPNNSSTSEEDYKLTPTPTAVGSGYGWSFYACVSSINASQASTRDVILFLRGNARGKPGVFRDNVFLPTLETRVLSRGVLYKDPG